MPNSIDSLTEAIGFVLNKLPATLEVVCECVEKRSELLFDVICEWIQRWDQRIEVDTDLGQNSSSKPHRTLQPRVPKQPKRLNDWKAAWRKIKGRWKAGGSNYLELAKLAGVSPETIADIVKAGDAGSLD